MSPIFEIDATDALDLSPLDEGTYEAEVESFSEIRTGPKSLYTEVTFVVIEEPYAGRKLFQNFSVDGKGSGFFLRFWEKVTGDELDIGDLHSIDTEDAMGASCKLVVIDDEYEGEKRSKIKTILRA